MGYTPCIAEPDVWMKQIDDSHYEYIAVYVDDLAIASKDCQNIISIFIVKYQFKLKGTGPIKFHLGMDFFHDKDGTLCYAPKKYIQRLSDSYLQMFNSSPHASYQSPLEHNDHPEIDDSDFLDPEGIQKFQSMIGSLQWVTQIGRIDITAATMTMSGFRQAPKNGHLERAKRMYGYLTKMKDAVIRIRTDEPDYSDLPKLVYDWERSVYGKGSEIMPHNQPKALGKRVIITSYVDANLFHDILTGRSVKGLLHLLNKTPIDWYSKKQATVETATYGSEYVAVRTCVEQIMDLRSTLRYMGVPVSGETFMFGDNKAVVDSSNIPHYKIHKRHNMLSYHRVREAIAYKICTFFHIDGNINPADILSKHWSYAKVRDSIKPLLFYSGNTMDLVHDIKSNSLQKKGE